VLLLLVELWQVQVGRLQQIRLLWMRLSL